MSTRGRRVAGVDVTEIDLTQFIESGPTGVPAGVIGTAERGPAFVPVWFSELRDWTIRYGEVRGQFGPLAVSEWLENAESALYIRLLGVGNGERRLPDGNVKEAGFIVGTDRVFDQDPTNQTVNTFAFQPSSGEQTPGRVFFLGALHEDRRGFDSDGNPTQDDLLLRSGIDTSITPQPVVRAVLVTPKGVVATLLSGTGFNPEPLEDVAPDASDADSYGSGAGLLGGSTLGYLVRARNNSVTSRLFLNGHIPTPEWDNDLEFSFDPRSAVYLAKVLNTNPERLEEAGHCLYAWWEVDPARVSVTGERVFAPETLGDDTATLGAFCIPGKQYLGTEFDDNAVNYENFEERYSEPLTPWVLSEELPGGERKRLFRVHVFDSGEGANTAYKIGISNIVRRENDWTRFDLTVRAWDDSDTKPVIIESFPGLTLDPDDRNYIVRRIGDTRLKYIWDANPENQGLLTSGLYPPVSRRIWIEVPDEVEDGLGTKDLLPVAHEGLPHITVDGWNAYEGEGLLFWDDALLGAAQSYEPASLEEGNFAVFPGTPSPNQVSFDLDDSSLFPSGADALVITLDIDGETRFTYVFDAPFTAAAVAGDPGLEAALNAAFGTSEVVLNDDGSVLEIELPLGRAGSAEVYSVNETTSVFANSFFSGIRQAPVPFRENLRVSPRSRKPNIRHHWGFRFNIPNVSVDGSLSNWSKFFPDFGSRPFWSKESGVAPDEDYGTILDVNEYNNNLFTLERVVARHLSGQPGVLDPNPVAWGSARYVRDADPGEPDPSSDERYVQAEDFSNSRNRPYLKFTFPVFGGFDGVNVFDRHRARFADQAVYAEREAGLPTGGSPVNPDDLANPIFGPTYTAWLRAAEILASEDDVDVQVLATPGLRHRSVVDRICDLTASRLDAVYLLDPEIIPDTEVDEEYTSDITIANLTNTIDRWVNREIDNTFVGAYFPDVVLPDPTTGRVQTVPASVAVLGTLAFSDAVAFPWFPAAGANRGVLTRVETIPVVFEEEAQARLYDVSINPLVDKGTLGPVVWGNKTTRQTESVLNRLSVRRLLIEIRRRVRTVAKDFLFEPNIEATLAEFQSRVNPILTDIKQKRGIQKALVYIDTTVTTQLDIENGVIRGIIGIQPTQAAEFAEIDFELRNTGDA